MGAVLYTEDGDGESSKPVLDCERESDVEIQMYLCVEKWDGETALDSFCHLDFQRAVPLPVTTITAESRERVHCF